MENKILIIEDEEITALALEQTLTSFGYKVTDCVNNAKDALNSIQQEKPDLILSDIMIKGKISGCEFALEMCTKSDIPFIFITAYFDEELLNYALDSNVHGYLLKPYNTQELEATIKIALNKVQTNSFINKIITFDTFSYDIETKNILQNDVIINIGKKSNKLLNILLENKDSPVSYNILIEYIYQDDSTQRKESLRQLVKRLKEKLNTNAIISVKNIGYLIKST